jgi:hypothetical protein
VTPIGFKPITAGAEIQCAIQLRHGAIFLASGANPKRTIAPRSHFFWRVVQILKGQLRHGAIFLSEWCKGTTKETNHQIEIQISC